MCVFRLSDTEKDLSHLCILMCVYKEVETRTAIHYNSALPYLTRLLNGKLDAK